MEENLLTNQELAQAAKDLQDYVEKNYCNRIHFLGTLVNAEQCATIRMGRPKPLAYGWASALDRQKDIINRLNEMLPD